MRLNNDGNLGIGETDPWLFIRCKRRWHTGIPTSGVDLPAGRRINL